MIQSKDTFIYLKKTGKISNKLKVVIRFILTCQSTGEVKYIFFSWHLVNHFISRNDVSSFIFSLYMSLSRSLPPFYFSLFDPLDLSFSFSLHSPLPLSFSIGVLHCPSLCSSYSFCLSHSHVLTFSFIFYISYSTKLFLKSLSRSFSPMNCLCPPLSLSPFTYTNILFAQKCSSIKRLNGVLVPDKT